jgi:hypothetical protein
MPRRTDANQAEIVAALRGLGCAVLDLHGVGGGVPDLLVCSPDGRRLWLVEVKSAVGELSQRQRRWRLSWPGRVVVYRTMDDVLRDLGVADAATR